MTSNAWRSRSLTFMAYMGAVSMYNLFASEQVIRCVYTKPHGESPQSEALAAKLQLRSSMFLYWTTTTLVCKFSCGTGLQVVRLYCNIYCCKLDHTNTNAVYYISAASYLQLHVFPIILSHKILYKYRVYTFSVFFWKTSDAVTQISPLWD